MTAAMAATLSDLSGGRFCLGLGAGWDSEEFALLEIPFPSAAVRSDLLTDTADACRRRLPGLTLLIGGEGQRRTLRTAAQFADATNWQVGLDSFQFKSRQLRDWCTYFERDFDKIQRTHAANVKIFSSQQEFRRWIQASPGGMSRVEINRYIEARGAFYGTEERIKATIDRYIEAGCRGFMLFCNDGPETGVLQQLARLRPVLS